MLSILFGINGNADRDGYFPEGAEENLTRFEASYRALLDSSLKITQILSLLSSSRSFFPLDGIYLRLLI